jgi:hypothetical protein
VNLEAETSVNRRKEMSYARVERLVEDLKKNEELRNELSGHAPGMESIVAFAKQKGYEVTDEEVSSCIGPRRAMI